MVLRFAQLGPNLHPAASAFKRQPNTKNGARTRRSNICPPVIVPTSQKNKNTQAFHTGGFIKPHWSFQSAQWTKALLCGVQKSLLSFFGLLVDVAAVWASRLRPSWFTRSGKHKSDQTLCSLKRRQHDWAPEWWPSQSVRMRVTDKHCTHVVGVEKREY